MRTPEENRKIKKAIWKCLPGNKELCDMCSYNDYGESEMHPCWEKRIKDTLAYIQQLEQELDALRADLEAVCEVVNTCLACGHYRTDWQKPGCELNDLTCKWSWRGVPEE